MYHTCRRLQLARLCDYDMLSAETVQRPIWFSFGIPYEFLMERSCIALYPLHSYSLFSPVIPAGEANVLSCAHGSL